MTDRMQERRKCSPAGAFYRVPLPWKDFAPLADRRRFKPRAPRGVGPCPASQIAGIGPMTRAAPPPALLADGALSPAPIDPYP